MSVMIWPIFLYPLAVGAIGFWYFRNQWKKREAQMESVDKSLFTRWSIWTILVGTWIILIFPAQRFGPPYISPDPLTLWYMYTYWIFIPTAVLFILIAFDTLRRI